MTNETTPVILPANAKAPAGVGRAGAFGLYGEC